MSADPEHYRAARLALPQLPLKAIFGFSVVGFGGALFLAYTTFSSPETTYSLASAKRSSVYEARAVPLDPKPEDAAMRANAVARALTAAPMGAERSETSEAAGVPEQVHAELLPIASEGLKGFTQFGRFGVGNSYLAVTGATFGPSGHMAPSGISATDAETIVSTPVPEASTWLCGIALLALVVARGLHASWHRHQRRSGNKSHAPR